MLKGNNRKFKRDFLILAESFIFALVLWETNIIDSFLAQIESTHLLGAFIAGLFFSSAFTTMPAAAFLVKISQFNSPAAIAFVGTIGALISDSVIFYLIKDKLIKDFKDTLNKPRLKRITHFFKSKIIRFSVTIISGILIALPLPTDEAAFALMGISKIKTPTFIIIAFTFNFIAIYLMASGARYFAA